MVAAQSHIPASGPSGLGWFCDFTTATTHEYFIVGLRSGRPQPYSNLMGWYAIDRRTGAILDYDVTEMRVVPHSKTYPPRPRPS